MVTQARFIWRLSLDCLQYLVLDWFKYKQWLVIVKGHFFSEDGPSPESTEQKMHDKLLIGLF